MLDWRLHLLQSKQQTCAEEIVGVTIDDAAAEVIAEEYGHYSPIPPDFLAALINNLAEYQPRLIGIDFLLDRAESVALLRQSISNARSLKVDIVLVSRLEREFTGEFRRPASFNNGLDTLASIVGFANIEDPDPDGKRRYFRPAIYRTDVLPSPLYPSFALAILGAWENDTVSEQWIDSILSKYQYPEKPDLARPINFFGRPQVMVSTLQVMAQSIPESVFKDKIVLIGGTYHTDEMEDRFEIPVKIAKSAAIDGVLLHANILSNFLKKRYIGSPSLWKLFLFAFILCGASIVIHLFIPREYTLAVLVGIIATYLGIGFLLFHLFQVNLPLAEPLRASIF
ncbi:MAG: CHASE2 domain-containing protein, partial [Aliifodinibius sp.]|nr:CHASE2 domain-containing protein [Fodinibius sp.]NIY24469.1 CHASE2 domain-containing protein [Fodinibius sp.]